MSKLLLSYKQKVNFVIASPQPWRSYTQLDVQNLNSNPDGVRRESYETTDQNKRDSEGAKME